MNLNATTPNATYLWNNGSTDPIYNVTSSGTYWVKVSINSLCSTSDTIKVNEIDSPPDYYLFNDTTLCLGTPINITIPDGTYYNVLWYDGNNTEFTHLINQEGSYYVELFNQCDTIKKDFNIKYKDCGCYIYFPNAFTPNGDGLNDYFKPVLQCELYVYELYIYNKWGELLFEAKTSDAYWDGRYKNEYVPTGVYEWLFYYKGPYTRELQSKHGSVTVIRQEEVLRVEKQEELNHTGKRKCSLASDLLNNLIIKPNSNTAQRLEILNLIGQTVYTSIINNKKTTVNTSAFANGVYILKLYTDKEIIVRKFVKE